MSATILCALAPLRGIHILNAYPTCRLPLLPPDVEEKMDNRLSEPDTREEPVLAHHKKPND